MSRPYPSSRRSTGPLVRVNGKIRAREVRVVSEDGRQLGIINLGEAIRLAQNHGVDLVEIAPQANPPVCRLVDFGKYRYEQSKKDKESKKHQHGSKMKEVQLRPSIDPHDFQTKLERAIDFLCEDMKVKVTLRFRGRENAHVEIGFEVVGKFINEVSPYAQPDAPPKKMGRGINVMLSPLPRNKRAKNPRESEGGTSDAPARTGEASPESEPAEASAETSGDSQTTDPSGSDGFTNNPRSQIDAES